ncbi:hypothetical protein CTAYLR_005490 [Chrysophaeum taylorii]|uniref:G domain-containing protein n=1 Tax=Chrysophaeum taylorii TaxID=2483200 RepID=A0AAD7XEI5_9STRA|nr:hypothetical protein CTAYLR_005490 [Chrysophaeum taylorii]
MLVVRRATVVGAVVGGVLRRQQQQQQRRGVARVRVGDTVAKMAVVGKKKAKGSSLSNKPQYCYGCGADVCEQADGKVGEMRSDLSKSVQSYWAQKKELLRKSQRKNWVLCGRCRELRRGGDAKAAVDDHNAVEIFRHEVSRLRGVRAVVVFVVDAANGFVLKSLREYAGGNPVVIAATRCDLLPRSCGEAEAEIRRRAEFLKPARVFMTSAKDARTVAPLANYLASARKGRDVYVVGGANIGKSTLVDALVDAFVAKIETRRRLATKEARMAKRMDANRIQALKELRVTTSALPGTTLQNVRIPCFQDHTQALWDTPGLAVAVPKQFFPIRDFERLRRSEPNRIAPILARDANLVAIRCAGDRDPMLRLQVVVAGRNDAVDVAWHSVYPLEMEKEDAEVPDAAPEPIPSVEAPQGLSKEERREWHARRLAAEREELGKERFEFKESEDRRRRVLAKGLENIQSFDLPARTKADLVVRDLGWFAIATRDRPVKLLVYALSTGVQCDLTPTFGLPFPDVVDAGIRALRIPKEEEEDAWSAADVDDKDDPLAEFSGERVGWKYIDDTRHLKGKHRLPEGWHPLNRERFIEEMQKKKKKKEEEDAAAAYYDYDDDDFLDFRTF